MPMAHVSDKGLGKAESKTKEYSAEEFYPLSGLHEFSSTFLCRLRCVTAAQPYHEEKTVDAPIYGYLNCTIGKQAATAACRRHCLKY
jgi:hypothetical protein